MEMTRREPLFGPRSFYAEALSIAVPVMLQTLVSSLVSLVDNFMVAGLGDAKMAGVNAANQINFIFMVLVNIVCISGGIYLAQHRGACDPAGMRQAFRFKLIVGLALAAVYTALTLAFPEFLIRIMVSGNSAENAIVDEGARYMRSVAPSFLPLAASAAFGTSYRETGNTRVPLIFSTVGALTNTLLNWIFIYGNLGAPRLEVAGAAFATDIARLVEMGGFIIWTARARPDFSIKLSRLFAIDAKLFGSILSRSGMMLFSEMSWVVSETVITALYNARGGAQTVAGMSAAWAIGNLFFLVFGAVHTATAVTVGSTLGAGKLDEARRRARWVMAGSVPFGAVVAVLAACSTFLIPIVFANLTPEARTTTKGMLYVIACYLPLWTLLNAQFAISRAGGDTVMGVWVDVGVTWAIFLPVAWILAHYTAIGPIALFGFAKLSDILKTLVAAWWLAKGRWVRNLATSRPPPPDAQ
ncbi:MAG: MATE family efflux transporter [Rectinemataceae bacterium]